ncbi:MULTISPECIES: acyltransferase family protein [unclassified Gordonia (in: high G+C Gram-positive bacteria)]|uniref:acyltransferase family protein n=1 Tax=Gordonia TaxID=2053 RepID=UPI000990D1C1|nr:MULTISPECIES: acyltransferase family protein [unclassified Gordonia (in: high G+C Gram-positive bacteria)]MCX2753675.1 acyltransferase family protein [Gordonia sp. 4N]
MRTPLTDATPVATPNEDAATGNTSGYRLDLDGLRGIAIALVAIFHVWFGRVSGGVDVFLTLSGYFFVASLLKHVLATQPTTSSWGAAINPWPRFSRLLRRLLPALLLVLAVTAGLIALIMPTTRWGPLGAELQASALYYQNWHLAFESQDYAAADSANSPMQHLWSMSMQGQFFVLTLVCALALGAVLRALGRRSAFFADPKVVRGVVGIALGVVALGSFAWANYRHGINQPFTYYDTVARLWEPLVGGLLAVWMPRIALSQRVRDLLGLVALGLIVTCGWWIAGVQEYPAAWALVPVGATLILIWVGSSQTAPIDQAPVDQKTASGQTSIRSGVSRGLAHPRLVWLGSIAYALYLWHWPLLIFYLAWRYQDDVSWFEGSAILAVSVLLAWLTTKYVEAPLRAGSAKRKQSPVPPDADGVVARPPFEKTRGYRRALVAVLVVISVAAGAAAVTWQRDAANATLDTQNLDPRLYPGARAFLDGAPVPNVTAQPSPQVVDMDWPITSYDSIISGWKDPSIKVGYYGNVNATRTIALVGGSHAEQWITALDAIGKRHDFRVTTYLKVGCALTTEHVFTWFGQKYYQCNDWSRRVMERLAVDKPDVVFTNSTRPVESGDGDYVPKDYEEIFAEFRDRGQRVVAVRDNPWATGQLKPPECLASGRKPEVCGVPRAQAMAPADPAAALAGEFPNMSFLDYTDAMCDDEYCPAVVGNILVWHDFHHLSATFVRSLIPAVEADLQRSLGWW